MDKKTPFFLTRLLRRSPQDHSEFGEQKGLGDSALADDTRFCGWGLAPISSGAITNGWADEPPDNHYNGWGPSPSPGSGSPIPEPTSNDYNGWGPSPHRNYATAEASNNGWVTDEPDHSELMTSKQSKLVNAESFPCPPVPSAPPLPDKSFNEHHADFVKKDVVSMNQSKSGDAWCVVCWEAPVEGACVPCGHMASCMSCLQEIESRQGTCPVCRAKIDKVLRIYANAISTE